MSYDIQKELTKVNKGKKGDNTPEWIVVHYVGASGQAMANANYFKNTYRGASAHYFIDPDIITQVVEDDTPAWHVGDGSRTKQGKHNGYVNKGGATNTNSIGIEGCQDTSTGEDVWNWDFHPDTIKKMEWLIKELQKKYDIDDAHVIRHYDASGKRCPGNWSHNSWRKWHNFKARLEKDIVQPAPSGNSNKEGKKKDDHMYLVEPGDTLTSIAKAHKVSVDDLVKWNDLEDPNLIFPESKLVVSGPKKQTSKPKPAKKKPLQTKGVEALAREVIDGKWGSGDERRRRLGNRYGAVQKRVNEILSSGKSVNPAQTKGIETLARETIAGKWKSGDERKKLLGSRYGAVQNRVNQILSGSNTGTGKSLNTLVNEVNRGLHGNGDQRKKSLGADYNRVQAEINRRAKK